MVNVEPPEHRYQYARDALQTRFGSKNVIIEATIRQLIDGPQIVKNDTACVCKLAAQMHSCEIILKAWDSETVMDYYEYLTKMLYRLSRKLQKCADREDNIDSPTFSHTVPFVERKAFLTTNFYGRLLLINSGSKPYETTSTYTRTCTYSID